MLDGRTFDELSGTCFAAEATLEEVELLWLTRTWKDGGHRCIASALHVEW